MTSLIDKVLRNARTLLTYTSFRLLVKPGSVLRSLCCAVVVACALFAPSDARSQRGSGSESAPIINRIVISGNDGVDEGRLKQQMRTRAPSMFAIFRKPRLDQNLLLRDVANLEGYYHSIGYYEATVTLERLDYTDDRRYVDIYIRVEERSPTLVESVTFSENALFDHETLAKGLLLKPGEPFNRSLLATDIYSIKTRYFNRGYLAVAIRDSVRFAGYRVSILYDIEPGTQITIRNINIVGTTTVRQSVVEKEFTFRSGDVCRLDKLLESQRNLFETGLFTIVDIAPENLDPIERSVDIQVRLRERKPAYVEAGFGVGNIVGSRVTGEWGTRNLYGTGRTLRFRVEYAYDLFEGDEFDVNRLQFENIFYRYDVIFQQRRVFRTKLNLAVETFLERDATVDRIDIRTRGASLGGRRRLGTFSEVISDFTIQRVDRRASGVREETNTHILSMAANHDKRDFVLNPRSGGYQIIRLGVAGGILGGDNDFYTASASLQRYLPKSGVVLAWRARVGYGHAYGRSDEVPIENRFFLGGSNSVRGYRQNSLGPTGIDADGEEVNLGGEFMMLTNIEIRHPLPLLSRINISGSLFADGGNVWASARDVRLEQFRLNARDEDVAVGDYRYSVGYGVRYNTPIGPIRFDYGLPIKTDALSGKSGRFHLTLGQIF